MIWKPFDQSNWHQFFAWKPVWLTNLGGKKVWWQWIERRWVGGITGWEYRLIKRNVAS